MQFTLKIERYNPDTDEGRLEEFTVDAPETATLLDVLDVIKDDGRRLAELPQVVPDGRLRLVRHAHGRRPPCWPARRRWRRWPRAATIPVISPMGNLPVIKDLVVDMEPFWEKFRRDQALPRRRRRRACRSRSGASSRRSSTGS